MKSSVVSDWASPVTCIHHAKCGVSACFLGVLCELVNALVGCCSRLYVLLAWLQAVVQERLRYVPLGWSKR